MLSDRHADLRHEVRRKPRAQPGNGEVVDGEPVERGVGGAGERLADGAQVARVGRAGVRAVLAGPAGDEERVDRPRQRQERLVGAWSRGGHRARLSTGRSTVGEARREVMDNGSYAALVGVTS
jgi:hypothetical protein